MGQLRSLDCCGWGNHIRNICLFRFRVGLHPEDLRLSAFPLNPIQRCITARKRRAAGAVPYRGTGWAGGRPPAGQPQYYPSQPQPYYAGNQYSESPQSPPPNVAPPVYVPPNQGYYGGDQNHGYFGGQQTGVELQTPDHSYHPYTGGQPVYNQPPGPPPGKA